MKKRRLKRRQAKAPLQVFSILIMFILIVACESDMDIQTVSLDSRVNPAQLQQDQDEDPNALLSENFYFFGVDRKNKSLENNEKHQALLSYLNQQTGYQFRLLYTAEGTTAIDTLGLDTVQFAVLDLSSTGILNLVRASDDYGLSLIVRNMSATDKVLYVVKNDSKIMKLSDLSNGRLAIVSGDLMVNGDLMPRIMLIQQGMTLDDIKKISRTDTAKSCLDMVMQDEVDTCVIGESLMGPLLYGGKLRVMASSAPLPNSGIASNIYVDTEVVEAVKKALLTYDKQDFRLLDEKRSSLMIKLLLESVGKMVSE